MLRLSNTKRLGQLQANRTSEKQHSTAQHNSPMQWADPGVVEKLMLLIRSTKGRQG
jgi:hypothetical protein